MKERFKLGIKSGAAIDVVLLLVALPVYRFFKQSGSGSRVRFEHERCAPIFMHRPHPSLVLKPYQIDQVLDVLQQEGLL